MSQIICEAFMCLQVAKPNTTRYGKNSVKYLAAITWNKISDTLRAIRILSAFKKAVLDLPIFLYYLIFLFSFFAFFSLGLLVYFC